MRIIAPYCLFFIWPSLVSYIINHYQKLEVKKYRIYALDANDLPIKNAKFLLLDSMSKNTLNLDFSDKCGCFEIDDFKKIEKFNKLSITADGFITSEKSFKWNKKYYPRIILWSKADFTVHTTSIDSFPLRPCPNKIAIFLNGSSNEQMSNDLMKVIGVLKKNGIKYIPEKIKLKNGTETTMLKNPLILDYGDTINQKLFSTILDGLQNEKKLKAGVIAKEKSNKEIRILNNQIHLKFEHQIDSLEAKTIINRSVKNYSLISLNKNVVKSENYSIKITGGIGYEIIHISNELLRNKEIIYSEPGMELLNNY